MEEIMEKNMEALDLHRHDSDSSILLYTLKQDGRRKGQPLMVNDVMIRIENANGSQNDLGAIAESIRADLAAPSAPAEDEGLTDTQKIERMADLNWKPASAYWKEQHDAKAAALTALQADNERLRADLEWLKRSIFGSANYWPSLPTANFAEMAQTTEAARKGALARAEKAEAEREAWKANAEAFVMANEDGEVEVWLWQHPDFESTKGMQDLRMDLFRARTSNAKLKGDV